MKTTDTMILFYGGPPSQWVRCDFIIDGIKYNCAEQFMMAEKARFFGDEEVLRKIMKADTPGEQKALGRRVKNFDADKWNKVARDIVVEGNYAKFNQNPHLKKWLMETGDRLIIEASPTDCIWGIGLTVDDPRALDQKQWRGTNWLGEAIMRVRTIIRGDKT